MSSSAIKGDEYETENGSLAKPADDTESSVAKLRASNPCTKTCSSWYARSTGLNIKNWCFFTQMAFQQSAFTHGSQNDADENFLNICVDCGFGKIYEAVFVLTVNMRI